MTEPVDINVLETFIKDLQKSIDSLEQADPAESKGFQAQLAKAISILRSKKLAKIETIPPFTEHIKKEELKSFLLNELKLLENLLDSYDYPVRKKFNLLKKVVELREKINIL